MLLVGVAVFLVAGFGYVGYDHVLAQRAQEAREAQEVQAQRMLQEQVAEEQQRQRAVQEHEAAIAAIHFESDPENRLPVYGIDELVARIWDNRKPLNLSEGQKIRIRLVLAKDDLREHSIHLMRSPREFLYDFYDVDFGFATALEAFNAGDEVEIVAVYEGTERGDSSDRYPSMTEHFRGEEIQKLP